MSRMVKGENLSWYQEMASGIIRKGKNDFHLFGTSGLGDINAFSIVVNSKRVNFSLNLKEVRASRLEEMRGNSKKIIGVCIHGTLCEDKEVLWWWDRKEFFLFSTVDSATRKSFSVDEKVNIKAGKFKIIIDLEKNRVKVCQL